MRRRGRQRRTLALPLGLALALVGLPGAAYTAALVLPTPRIGATNTALPTYAVAVVAGTYTRGGLLNMDYTGFKVEVTPTPDSAGADQVHVRARATSGTLTGWTTCNGRTGNTWTCTWPAFASSGGPTVGAYAALP